MQTALGITDAQPGVSYHQRHKLHRRQPGNKQQEKKKAAARRSHNDFLMGRILPMTPDYYINKGETGRINLTTEESFEYLYLSAQRYATLAGIDLPFRRTKETPRINIINLYKVLDSILPQHLNLEEAGGRLHFCLYQFHDWEDSLYWIPLDFTARLPKQLKRITLEFIRRFARHHGMQDITDTYYYEMAGNYLNNYGDYDEEATTEQIKGYAATVRSYEEGKAHRVLQRMKKRNFCANLEGEIEGCHPGKGNEQALLDLIKEGMEYISPETPRIIQYSYDWAYEESPEFSPIELDVQLALTYSINDALADEMESYYRSDWQESYAITPVTRLYLTPETDRLFAMDDFPERLCLWLNRFIKHVANNF